ncbi:MAG: hypothetical protein IK066_05355 [Kiritimatiellae bacterium]|nr:hypothetical protein [Kiritimatiellia bacterium]
MKILQNILSLFREPLPPPPPPPPPAGDSDLAAARADAVSAIKALRRRLLEEQRRQKEAHRRWLEAQASGEDSPESNVRYSIAARPSAEWLRLRASLEADLLDTDPRAFAKRVLQGVREVYAGNPVPFYTAAGLSRSAYSKIISHPDRHPAKDTVLAMAAALKMGPEEAARFLDLAGYSLSDSIPSDLVWRACFSHGVHHLPQITALLDEFAPRRASYST